MSIKSLSVCLDLIPSRISFKPVYCPVNSPREGTQAKFQYGCHGALLPTHLHLAKVSVNSSITNLSTRCRSDVFPCFPAFTILLRVSTLVRIFEVPNPQQVAVLEILMKEATSSSQEGGDRGQSDQRGGMTDNDIERAIICALEPLQKLADFDELVSMANDYNQTLAHFAGLSGYSKLLRRLVEWNIDLTIADVNGLTPLHCAYKGGCRVCVELLLDAGASGSVLDAIGKTPTGLLPGNFEWLMGAVSLDDSTDSIDQKLEANSVTGAKPGHNSEECSSGNNISDHESVYDNKPRRISILALHNAVGGSLLHALTFRLLLIIDSLL